MNTLDRYVLNAHVGPFAFGLCVATGVMFTEILKTFLVDFLTRGVPAAAIAELLFLGLAPTFTISVPMAVLAATLLAFGNMSQDHELTAMKASGVSLYRVVAPVLIVATLLSSGMFCFNNYVLPESNHRMQGLILDIKRKRPTVNIKPGIFVDEFEKYKFIIGGIDEDSDEILDVRVVAENPGRAPEIIVAPRGRMYFDDNGKTLNVALLNGCIHSVPEPFNGGNLRYRETVFKRCVIVIPDAQDEFRRVEREYRSDREMSVAMLRERIRDTRSKIARATNRVRMDDALPRSDGANEREAIDTHEREVRALEVEIHKKFAISAACIIFALLGPPLAIRARHSGVTMAISFNLLCFTVYYLLLLAGEALAEQKGLAPFWAMWGGNVAFGILGIDLMRRSVTEITVFNYRRLNPKSWWPTRSIRAQVNDFHFKHKRRKRNL